MNAWSFKSFVYLLVWIITLFIFLGYFNSWGFYCSHSNSWRLIYSLCSVISMGEGITAVIFVTLSINSSLLRTAASLFFVLSIFIVLEWVRGSDILQCITVSLWKILGVFIGLGLFSIRCNWRHYLFVCIVFLLMSGVWVEETDMGIIKTFSWLIGFLLVAFLIKIIRSTERLKNYDIN